MVRAKRRKRKPRQPTEQIVTCEDEIALIADYLSSSLSSRVLRTFEEHLQGCRDCTAFLQTYKKTIEVTRSFFRDEVSDKPRKSALRVPNGDGNRH
jgi:Putative zinc-finger